MSNEIKICWLGQGGFILENDNYRIVLDPYISDCVFKIQQLARMHKFPFAVEELKTDLLLITHDHMDHFDPEGVPEILAEYPECCCAGPQNSYEHFQKLNVPEQKLTLSKAGESFSAGPFKITAIPAFHSDKTACGYMLECAGKKIVVTGDTLFNEALFVPEINNADLLLICINGKFGNMTDSEALEYVKRTSPRCALPMHYGLFAENTIDPADFIADCKKSDVASWAMTPGVFFSI